MAPVIKVAALSGSLRKASYNTGSFALVAIELTKGDVEGVEIELIDISGLPFVNTDLEKGGTWPTEVEDGTWPTEVEALRSKILAADSILFASPEYNYSVSGHLKNAIDWASWPPNVWAGKAAAIVSAGGGHGGAKSHYHLRQIGVFLDIHFINKPEFFINAFQPPAKFNSDGDLINEDAKNKLKEILLTLKEFTLRLQGKI